MEWVRMDEALKTLSAIGVETSRFTLYARINKGWRWGTKILGRYYISAAWLAYPYEVESDETEIEHHKGTCKICGASQ